MNLLKEGIVKPRSCSDPESIWRVGVKKVWILSLAIVAVVVAVLVVTSQQPATASVTKNAEEKKEEKKEPIYPVELADVQSKELQTYLTASATLRADRQVEIFSKLAGQVLDLAVEEGDKVEKDQVLLSLDGDDARLQLDQSTVALAKAKAEFERISKSYSKELVSTEEYDTRKYEFERAQADHDLAKYKLTLTQVVAPFSGTIVAREVELGQTIQPSQKLFSLAALEPLEADVYLPESQVRNLREGLKARLTKNDNFEESFTAVVARVAPVVDKETGTVKVTLNVNEIPDDVRPGTYVNIRIITSTQTAPMVLPKKALVYDSHQTAYAYVTAPTEEDPNVLTVKKTAVTTGIAEGDFVSITEGLTKGDHVVLTGKESLKDGAKVKNAAAETIADNS